MKNGFMKWGGLILVVFAIISMRGLIADPNMFYFRVLPKLFSLIVGGVLLGRSRKND